MNGTIVDFDDDRGLGTVRSEDGRVYPFHCTQITDGSRTIQSRTPVRFEVMPGANGRWEATRISPAGEPARPRPQPEPARTPT